MAIVYADKIYISYFIGHYRKAVIYAILYIRFDGALTYGCYLYR